MTSTTRVLRALTVLLALVVVPIGVVSAPLKTASPVRYALLSAVGDQLTVVYAKLQTGSRLDSNEHQIAALPDNALDRLVLRRLDAAVRQNEPTAEVAALAAANAGLFAVQRDSLSGQRPDDAAVRAFAAALPAGSVDRLLLVLKHRSEARIPAGDGTVGLGRLEGVGFYVDRVTALRSQKSGVGTGGFLAPFAYFRLVLADAEGRILAQQPLEAAQTFLMGDTPDALQPWEIMDAPAKVEALDRLLNREIEQALPRLLAQAR
jgi:hypothetical protein